jgi:hypothetical protein
MVSGDGYRLLWFQSKRKAAMGAATRNRRAEHASAALAELQERLSGPRTRFRQRGQVEQAVARLLEEPEIATWLAVRVPARSSQDHRGAPALVATLTSVECRIFWPLGRPPADGNF